MQGSLKGEGARAAVGSVSDYVVNWWVLGLAAIAGEKGSRSGVGRMDARTRWGGTRFLQRARWSRHDRGDDQMAGSNAHGAPVTRVELREVLDGIRDEVVRNLATKADFADLKTWIVCTLLVAVVNLVGTVGMIAAALLTR